MFVAFFLLISLLFFLIFRRRRRHHLVSTAFLLGQFVVHRIKVAGLEERAVAGLTERNKRITSLEHKIAYVAPPLPALPPPDALVKMLSSGEGEEEPAPEVRIKSRREERKKDRESEFFFSVHLLFFFTRTLFQGFVVHFS